MRYFLGLIVAVLLIVCGDALQMADDDINNEVDYKAHFALLKKAIIDSGGYVHPSMYVKKVENRGISLFTSEHLDAGTVVLEMPMSTTWNKEHIASDSRWQSALSAHPFDDAATVYAYYYATEYKKAQSLEELHIGAVFFSRGCLPGGSVLQAVQGVFPEGSFEHRLQEHSAEAQKYEWARAHLGGQLSFGEFQAVLCAVNARAFNVVPQINERYGSYVIVPIGDLMNHDRRYHNVIFNQRVAGDSRDSSGDSFYFETIMPVRKDHELLDSYTNSACREALFMISHYGFFDADDAACFGIFIQHQYLTAKDQDVNTLTLGPYGWDTISDVEAILDACQQELPKYKEDQNLSIPVLQQYYDFSREFLKKCVSMASDRIESLEREL